jgi:hypothetical protein
MATQAMTKTAQNSIQPGHGSVYYENLTLSAPGTSVYIIMPTDEVYDMAFVLEGAGTDFLDVTIDTVAMMEADTANWETWNETDPISKAITGFRLRSTAGAGALRATVKTRV